MIVAIPSLSISEALNRAISKLFNFSGRARRSEFWWTMLVIAIVATILPIFTPIFLVLAIPITFRRLHDTGRSGWWWGFGALLNLSFWGFIIYEIARIFEPVVYYPTEGFNDIINSNFVIIYAILGIVSAIYNLVLFFICCLDSEPCENKYGESPKYGYIEINENRYNR